MTKKQRRERKQFLQERKAIILAWHDSKGRRTGAYWTGGVIQDGKWTKRKAA